MDDPNATKGGRLSHIWVNALQTRSRDGLDGWLRRLHEPRILQERMGYGMALFMGWVAVLGMPPDLHLPLLFVALTVLLRQLVEVGPRRGAWLGFFFGLGHFLFGFSWLWTSLHDHGGLSPVVTMGLLCALSAIMALYVALFGAAVAFMVRIHPVFLPLAAPPFWVLSEWLRGQLYTGFPWNLAGYALSGHETIIQSADLGGVHLLSFLTILPSAAVAFLWAWPQRLRVGLMMAAGVVAILGAAHLYGVQRLSALEEELRDPTRETGIWVAVVQGSISQSQKWDPDYRDQTMEIYTDLTQSFRVQVDLVVWPETAIPFFLQVNPEYVKWLGEVSETIGSPILTGMPMVETTPDRWKYYNSMVMLTQDRSLTRRYDKYHLVPFGEFIPFRSWMPGTFRKFTEGTEDFSRGLGPVPMAWDKGAIGPLICYEVIFPGEVRKLAAAGARWLVNITNDAWFGDAAKPQHLAMTRMRAIENRLPLIRAANTGISAVFDHMGREIGRLEPHWRTALVAPVPAGLNNSHFRQYGAWWSAAWIVLCALLVMAALLLRHRNRRPSVEYVVVPGPPDEPPMCC